MRDAPRGPTRVKGRPALERRLRGVQLALVRYGQHRATRPEDLRWTQRAFDAIALVLSDPPARAGLRDEVPHA